MVITTERGGTQKLYNLKVPPTAAERCWQTKHQQFFTQFGSSPRHRGVWETERGGETERQRGRRETETERQREGQRQTDTQTQRDRGTERDRDTERDKEREREK